MTRVVIHGDEKQEQRVAVKLVNAADYGYGEGVILVSTDSHGDVDLYIAKLDEDGLHLFAVGAPAGVKADQNSYVEVYRDH